MNLDWKFLKSVSPVELVPNYFESSAKVISMDFFKLSFGEVRLFLLFLK